MFRIWQLFSERFFAAVGTESGTPNMLTALDFKRGFPIVTEHWFKQTIDNRELQGAGVHSKYAAPTTSFLDIPNAPLSKIDFCCYQKKSVRKFWRKKKFESGDLKKIWKIYNRFGRGFKTKKVRQNLLTYAGTGLQAKYLVRGTRKAPGKFGAKPKPVGFPTNTAPPLVFANAAAAVNSTSAGTSGSNDSSAVTSISTEIIDTNTNTEVDPNPKPNAIIAQARNRKKKAVAACREPTLVPTQVASTAALEPTLVPTPVASTAAPKCFNKGTVLALPATKISGDLCWIAVLREHIKDDHRGNKVKVQYAELTYETDATLFEVLPETVDSKVSPADIICALPPAMLLASTASSVILEYVSMVMEERKAAQGPSNTETNVYRKTYSNSRGRSGHRSRDPFSILTVNKSDVLTEGAASGDEEEARDIAVFLDGDDCN